MTKEQLDSLSRVRAACASFNHSSYDTGSYRTEDMRAVLDLLESKNKTLFSVKEDLEDLREMLMVVDRESVRLMMDSTLELVCEELA